MKILHKESLCRWVAAALVVLAIACAGAQQPARASQSTQGSSLLLRITTREVLVDVVALDRRGRPVRDLTAKEIEILEVNGRRRRDAVRIASFRPTDAAVDLEQPAPQSGGFRVSMGGNCAARATFHYEVSFHPDREGWQSGFHQIEVRTTRRGVKLEYRKRYYVGRKDALPKLPSEAKLAVGLQTAACYHPDVPLSIGLSAHAVHTDLANVLRYFVTVDSDSLGFISVSFNNLRVQLDYGACTFDSAGKPIRYFSSAADRMLTSSEYASASVHGLPNLLEFPRVPGAVLMRVVVRDRSTENFGLVDIPIAQDAQAIRAAQVDLTHSEHEVERIALQQMSLRNPSSYVYIPPPPGPIGSFGSIVSAPNRFCGDVYDLPGGTMALPNFWNLSSIASIYTASLDVPHQIFDNSGGIPGITQQTAWIGIDYHANFWVRDAGTYEFRLLVDDGAILFIDDSKVIDMNGVNSGRMAGGNIQLSAGMHSMHVPYIQGPPNAVGLVLAVKPPAASDFRIFDLRDFAPPVVRASPPLAAQ